METEQSARLAALNDRLRREGQGGLIMISSGIAARGKAYCRSALAAIGRQTIFDADDDPYAEHDFGVVRLGGDRLFWKIEYYDLTFTFAAEDPTDEARCRRVLTVMLAEEY